MVVVVLVAVLELSAAGFEHPNTTNKAEMLAAASQDRRVVFMRFLYRVAAAIQYPQGCPYANMPAVRFLIGLAIDFLDLCRVCLLVRQAWRQPARNYD